MRIKLDYVNFSLSKKISIAILASSVFFFLFVGSVLFFQMRKALYTSEKERLEAQAAAFETALKRNVATSKQVVGIAASNLADLVSGSTSVGDSSIMRWMKSVVGEHSKNLYVVLSDASSSKVYHYNAAGTFVVGVGGFAENRFPASEVNPDKEVGIAISSDKNPYFRISTKHSLPDGRSVVVGLLEPTKKLVAAVNYKVEDDTLSVLMVNDSGDILTSNYADYVGKNLSSLSDRDGAASLAASSGGEKVKRVNFNDDTYIGTYLSLAEINASGGVVFLSPRSGIHFGFFFMVLLVVSLVWTAIVIILLKIFNTRILAPIHRLIGSLREISRGRIADDLKVSYALNDELGEMTRSINGLVDSLNDTARFATEIGEGNLACKYEPRSGDDKLGVALLGMQESLAKARELEEAQKLANKKSHWANEGMAKFSEILRNNHDNLKEMSFDVIKSLVKYVDAIQGGMFVLNNDVDDDEFLEMTACFAYNRRKMHQKRVEMGEGLVGRCFYEKQPILLKEVPNDYIEITSGLGENNPNNLLLVPLKINDVVNGVLEIASFKEFEEYQIQFVEKIAESISSTITSVRINERTSALLERSQVQAEMMAAQEEEMRQNLEELQATQEELEKRARENEQMTRDLEKEKYLLDALLSNIPDYIYFKDDQSRFIRVSESMAPLFQARSGADLIGKSDFDFHSAEHANKAYAEEMEIIRTGNKIIDHIDHETWDDGREQWVSTTKMPLVAADGRTVGTFGISKVITNIKRLEIEMHRQNEEMRKREAELLKTIDELRAKVNSQS